MAKVLFLEKKVCVGIKVQCKYIVSTIETYALVISSCGKIYVY